MSRSDHAKRFSISLLIVSAGLAAVVIAQAPRPGEPFYVAPPPARPMPSSASVQQSLQEILEEPATGETYRYDPQGRRDPFQSLVGPAPRIQPGQRPPGVPGFLIDEMKLQGVVRTRQGLVAMVNGPDNKGYLIRVGDKVLDGEVIRITASSVVFRQEVNDPTRIERYREVVKDLVPVAR
jgi:type IV pilus assembly protein PilP